MIELERAQGRVAPLALAPITATLGAGVHALVGGKGDGASIVLALVAARVALRGGALRVLGMPAGDARVRAAVAHVPLDVALPEPLRVREALAMASSIRGEPPRDAVTRLDVLGLGMLAQRPVRSLSHDERRAVALAEALTSQARVILIEEPLASTDPRAVAPLPDALRARARAGACVVIVTGSVRDARALADDVLVFDRGALVRRAAASDPMVLAGPRGATMHVVASDPRRLAAALAGEPDVRAVAIEADVLVVRGADAVAIASAVARVALEAGVTIDALRPDLLRDDELRAAIAGDVAGAYRAAYERAGRHPGAPAPIRTPSEET